MDALSFKHEIVQLKNVEGWIRKSDPFFELARQIDSAGAATWDVVYRSEVVKNNLNPDWKEAIVEVSLICGGNYDLPLRVRVFDEESNGKHDYMGSFETTVNHLIEAYLDEDATRSMTMMSNGDEVGNVRIEMAEVSLPANRDPNMPLPRANVEYKPKPSFVEYINGGCELGVVVAIDYTGSNGNPSEPGTLHYYGDGLNDYEKAIKSLLGILSQYDHDQKYPVFGFGAKYGGVVRHCFQCGEEPEADGVDGVLSAYKSVFSTGLIMSSPTDFTQVIDVAAARARKVQENADTIGGQAYTILLIISDGAVADPQATMDALEAAADAPLSIVIVGVGEEDFAVMEFLDASKERVGRDMVQFVEFNRYRENSAELTSATLKEIPHQLVSYFLGRDIEPLPPVQVEEEEIVAEEQEAEIDLSLNVDEEEIVVSGGGVNVVNSFQ
jgi:hypothetical protein